MFKGNIEYVPINKLVASPFDIRSDFGDITTLRESIKQDKIRDPLLVVESTQFKGKYDILDGNMRLKVAQQLGLNSVPAIILQGILSEDEKLKIAIITNTIRKSLTPRDQAKAIYQYYKLNPDKSAETMAAEFGLSRKQVRGYLYINALSPNLKIARLRKHSTDRREDEIATTFAMDLARVTQERIPNDDEKRHNAQEDFVEKTKGLSNIVRRRALKGFQAPTITLDQAIADAVQNTRYHFSGTFAQGD